MKGIMDINSILFCLSLDFKGNPHSCVYDKQHTQKNRKLHKNIGLV